MFFAKGAPEDEGQLRLDRGWCEGWQPAFKPDRLGTAIPRTRGGCPAGAIPCTGAAAKCCKCPGDSKVTDSPKRS
jgi:hypothetical protein